MTATKLAKKPTKKASQPARAWLSPALYVNTCGYFLYCATRGEFQDSGMICTTAFRPRFIFPVDETKYLFWIELSTKKHADSIRVRYRGTTGSHDIENDLDNDLMSITNNWLELEGVTKGNYWMRLLYRRRRGTNDFGDEPDMSAPDTWLSPALHLHEEEKHVLRDSGLRGVICTRSLQDIFNVVLDAQDWYWLELSTKKRCEAVRVQIETDRADARVSNGKWQSLLYPILGLMTSNGLGSGRYWLRLRSKSREAGSMTRIIPRRSYKGSTNG